MDSNRTLINPREKQGRRQLKRSAQSELGSARATYVDREVRDAERMDKRGRKISGKEEGGREGGMGRHLTCGGGGGGE